MRADSCPVDISLQQDKGEVNVIVRKPSEPSLAADAVRIDYDSSCYTLETIRGSPSSLSQGGSMRVEPSDTELCLKMVSSKSSFLKMVVHSSASSTDEAWTLSYNLAQHMCPSPMEHLEFQKRQGQLAHAAVLDCAPAGCDYSDFVAEVLKVLRMMVVLDKKTSWSRTSWLSGRIVDQPVLVVLDGMDVSGRQLVSLDVWSGMPDAGAAVLELVARTAIGKVCRDVAELEVSLSLERVSDSQSQLVISMAAGPLQASPKDIDIHFTVDYQGILSEEFRTRMPAGPERVSVAIDLANLKSIRPVSLDMPYLVLSVTDGLWKSRDESIKHEYSWRDTLVKQIERKLDSGKRFSDYSELAAAMSLNNDDDTSLVRDLFASFCIERNLHGCENSRTSQHCLRTAVLTGLAICFNPARGLSGYLDMVDSGQQTSRLTGLGSERTWRDHISQIAGIAQDFTMTKVKVEGRRKPVGPGRPPTQLTPSVPPSEMFRSFVSHAESVACRNCRFNERA